MQSEMRDSSIYVCMINHSLTLAPIIVSLKQMEKMDIEVNCLCCRRRRSIKTIHLEKSAIPHSSPHSMSARDLFKIPNQSSSKSMTNKR